MDDECLDCKHCGYIQNNRGVFELVCMCQKSGKFLEVLNSFDACRHFEEDER